MPRITDQVPAAAVASSSVSSSRRPGTRAASAATLKAFLVRLHRYAGLGAALFLVAAGISGAMIAVEGTLLPPSFVAEHHSVEPRAQRMPLEPVLAELQERYGERPGQLTIRRNSTLPDEYRVSSRETVYVDPYRGEIVASATDFRTPFSRAVWDFHSSLLLGRPGEWVVLLATGVLLASLLGGLALVVYDLRLQGWRALSLRWTGNGRSWNRHFHNLMGILWAPLLVAIAASSFYRAFPAVERLTLDVLGVPLQAPAEPRSNPVIGGEPLSPDAALDNAGLSEDFGAFERVRLQLPRTPDDTYRIQVLGGEGVQIREWIFIDQYTGERLTDLHGDVRLRREGTRDFIRSLHSGTFHGSAIRAIWAVASAMLAVFVASGFLIWRSKRRVRAGRAAAARSH